MECKSNKICEKIFKNLKANHDKLIEYGFNLQKNGYFYQKKLKNDEFCLNIQVEDNVVKTKVVEKETGEEYILFLLDDAVGEFVIGLRSEYEKALDDIAQACFDREVFTLPMTQKIISYVKKKYNNELEYLWEKFPKNAICRRDDNKKWYAAFIKIPKSKLGNFSQEEVEILDLRANSEDIERLIDNKTFFPAYHMNKKSWITISLNDIKDETILYELIDKSYMLAAKK